MEQFLGFALPGVPYGCTYALVAVCLVLTYQATGVFNFAFGAQAYASAFVFTYLTQFRNWSGFEAFLRLGRGAWGRSFGWAFDRLIFRHIAELEHHGEAGVQPGAAGRHPILLPVIFGPQNLDATATILPFFNPNVVYFTILGTPINGIYLATISVTVVVLILLTILLRYTSLGLQMRGAVESRRLVQLDGVNANGVVAIAWIVSSFMASLAGVILAPVFGAFTSDELRDVDGDGHRRRRLGAAAIDAGRSRRCRPHRRGDDRPRWLHPAEQLHQCRRRSGAALPVSRRRPALSSRACATSMPSRDPMATIDPPPPPIAATDRAPSMDRIIRVLWWVLFAAFCVSMLTWMPDAWETVFNNGLTYSIVLLSITLITGMAGQLSLCQATLAGVGAFTAAQLANHLGLNLLIGGLVGAALAAAVAVVLALLSLRLKGLGLALMTLAAALALRRHVLQRDLHHRRARGREHPSQVAGHACLLRFQRPCHVPLVARRPDRRGHRRADGPQGDGRSEPGGHAGERDRHGGPGVNPTWQRIVVFALSGAIAGIGGLLHSLEQQVVSPDGLECGFSLVLVVLVVTTERDHRRGCHSGRHRVLRDRTDLDHRPPGPHRRVEPDRRAVRLRCAHVRVAP